MIHPCRHCGEPSPGSDFCCSGCRVAFDLIQGAGLEAIYSQPERQWKPPVETAVESFQIFDDGNFLDRRAPLDAEGLRSIDLGIGGLMCSACIYIVEKLPRFVAEIRESRVDYGRGRVFFRFENKPGVLLKAALTLSRLGYQLSPALIERQGAQIPKIEWIRLGLSALSAAGAMHIGLVLLGAHEVGIDPSDARKVGLFAGLAALPAVTFGAWPFFRSMIQNLKMRYLSADLLVSLAIFLGTIASFRNAMAGSPESYFDALAMIVFLLLGGRILVRLSTLKVVQQPLWMARQKGRWIAAESLKVGEGFQLEKDELCPADSVLRSPEAWFDLSSLTGENIPVRMLEGQNLLQGSKALSACDLRLSRPVSESYLENLGRYLRSQSWQTFPPSYEGILTLGVISLAISVLIWGGQNRLSEALAILIVTCPCALQLAKPLVMTAFKSQAHQAGLLIFRPDRISNWTRVKDIYLDKTGTLTKGAPEWSATEVVTPASLEPEVLNAIIYELAKVSMHPISRSLALLYAEKPRRGIELSAVGSVAGVGVTGKYLDQDVSLRASEKEHQAAGLHVSVFIGPTEILRFYFLDAPRSEAASALTQLKGMGFHLHLLSGDRQNECDRLGLELGEFSSIHGEQTPEQKARFQNQVSAFVGDGLNDALAMRSALVSVGFSGSAEASIQTADSYMMNHDLRLLPQLIRGARSASSAIRNLLGLSFIYNVVCIGLVFAGVVGPIVCAIFMPLSSLSVILIASRTTYFQKASI